MPDENVNIPPALAVTGLSREYARGASRVRALDGVTLSVERGEFLALVGPSGSGKSTLLNLMAGLDRPTAGSIVAAGRDLAALTSDELAHYRNAVVGMVFQAFNLLPRMTLEENVELPLRLAGREPTQRAELVRAALACVGLESRAAHRPGELSGGEQQRGAIARALVLRPRILLADEPTGNLDSRTAVEILDLMDELRRDTGATIVMVTHEQPLAERYAGRIARLRDGRLVSLEARA